MTPEAQRIAIAEACGFFDVHWYEDDAGPPMLVGTPPPSRPKHLGRTNRHVPDYLNDLNAMHGAEKVLTDEKRKEYREHLSIMCLMAGGPIHATAAQRCKAFLKTLSLWREEAQ